MDLLLYTAHTQIFQAFMNTYIFQVQQTKKAPFHPSVFINLHAYNYIRICNCKWKHVYI